MFTEESAAMVMSQSLSSLESALLKRTSKFTKPQLHVCMYEGNLDIRHMYGVLWLVSRCVLLLQR